MANADDSGVGLLVGAFLLYSVVLGDGAVIGLTFIALIFVVAPLVWLLFISKMFKDNTYRGLIFWSILLVLLALIYSI